MTSHNYDPNNSETPKLTKPQILDARKDETDNNGVASTKSQIFDGLSKPDGEKRLPTMLLYDEQGLKLYDDITTKCHEYYLFLAEEQIVKNHAEDIVSLMHKGTTGQAWKGRSAVVELGAGALRKTSHILVALSKFVDSHTHAEEGIDKNDRDIPSVQLNINSKGTPVTYYALDLEWAELDRCLTLVSSNYSEVLQGKVDTKGIWGTYDDGLKLIIDGGLGDLDWKMDCDNETVNGVYVETGSGGYNDKDVVNTISCSNMGVGSPIARSDSESSSREGSLLLTPPSSPGTGGSMEGYNTRSKLRGGDRMHFLFLGSSIGNFSRPEASAFLKSLPMKQGDTLLLGMDHDNPKELIELAYGEPAGVTEAFIMNGLRVAGRTLGDETLFDASRWEYVHWYSEDERRHVAYYKSKVNHTVTVPSSETKFSFLEGELVNIEVSHKYSEADAHKLFIDSELRPITRWMNEERNYSLWLLERPPFTFPLIPSPVTPATADTAPITNTSFAVDTSAMTPAEKLLRAESPFPFGIPSLNDFRLMWKAWDTITVGMIPPSLLFKKPIDLRHICLFYMGHIPAFLDIFLSRFLEEPHSEPTYFKDIFERGIDPHVDDPTQCHPHSIVPINDEDWPTLESILDFRDRVRARVGKLYEDIASGKVPLSRRCGRVLHMTYEHETFHAETLLYMLLQATGNPNGALPPPGFASPPWDLLAENWNSEPLPTSLTVTLGPTTVTLGHDDDESQDDLFTPETLSNSELEDKVANHEYGWDNEHPKREVEVKRFKISWRPVTNGEFWKYWVEKGKEDGVKMPATWVDVDGEVKVMTFNDPVPMRIAQHWPVLTSYDSLSKYATVHGGRLPTDAELRHFYDKFEIGFESGGSGRGSVHSSEGDVKDKLNGGIGAGANVGYRNWHPVPATTGCMERGLGGRGHNGGIWEWTSTDFDMHEGFVQSKLYPGFSTDFFDGKHKVVLRGAYATVPRQAHRRSLRNFYQHNYPYAWVGARVVYDV